MATKLRLIWRICSPKPGITLSATASVASGVTSRSAGPVPPVVSTRSQWARVDQRLATRRLMPRPRRRGSGGSSQVIGLRSARPQPGLKRRDALVLVDAAEARSLIDTRPMRARVQVRHGVTHRGTCTLDELEQLAESAAAALARAPARHPCARCGSGCAVAAASRVRMCSPVQRVRRRRWRSVRRASVRPRAAPASPWPGRAAYRSRPGGSARCRRARISLPMYCIWRRLPSWVRVRLYSRTASSSVSGSRQASSTVRRAARPAPRRVPAARAMPSCSWVLLGRSSRRSSRAGRIRGHRAM